MGTTLNDLYNARPSLLVVLRLPAVGLKLVLAGLPADRRVFDVYKNVRVIVVGPPWLTLWQMNSSANFLLGRQPVTEVSAAYGGAWI